MSTIDLNNPPDGYALKVERIEPEKDGELRRRREWWTFLLIWAAIFLVGIFLACMTAIHPDDKIGSAALNGLVGLLSAGLAYLVGQRSRP